MSAKANDRIYTAVIINRLDPDWAPWISAFGSREKRDAFVQAAQERIALAGKEDELMVMWHPGGLFDTL